MKLEIQDAIQDLTTPEQLAVILDVIETLMEKDYVLALDELNTVLMIADDMADSTMLVSRINDILHYAMVYCLNDFGVVMNESATLRVMHDIYKTLIYIPQYIIPDDLIHVLQCDYDDAETLANLVPYFTSLRADQVLDEIEYIEESCIVTIRKQLDAKLTNETVYIGTRPPLERIKVINRLLATNDRTKFSMMLELADAGVRVGRSFEELINISFEALEGRNPVEAAAQLVGLAFFSDAPLGGIWRQIDVTLDEYTDNPMERRMMLDEISVIKRNVGTLDETT